MLANHSKLDNLILIPPKEEKVRRWGEYKIFLSESKLGFLAEDYASVNGATFKRVWQKILDIEGLDRFNLKIALVTYRT